MFSSHQGLAAPSLALLTDLYQLTMGCAYWKGGMKEEEAVFHLFFRRNPFEGGFTLAAGLQLVIDYLKRFRFSDDDIAYLSSLTGERGLPLFDLDFLNYLRDLKFSCDLSAIPEGSVVFPYEPLIRVEGPLIQAQLVESILLNLINFSSLIATKAARICLAARGDPVLEFGLRRAQGMDGALTATRAAYLGGCAATSNVLAGKLLGIPVKGTHAHSWVMAFEEEQEAFAAYARLMPQNAVFLVDTYDTLEGVRKAIEVGKWLKSEGRTLQGVRLDSGDLAELSIQARAMLDKAGFSEAVIYASNELDETIIRDLKAQGAQIAVWGVGTNLVTSRTQPALDGVYKLSALRSPGKPWRYCMKLSEQLNKVSLPGILQVRRYFGDTGYTHDMIYNMHTPMEGGCTSIDPFDVTRQQYIEKGHPYKDLLQPVFHQGECVYQSPSLSEIRDFAQAELASLPLGVKRFLYPHEYPVGLEATLYQQRLELMQQQRKRKRQHSPWAANKEKNERE